MMKRLAFAFAAFVAIATAANAQTPTGNPTFSSRALTDNRQLCVYIRNTSVCDPIGSIDNATGVFHLAPADLAYPPSPITGIVNGFQLTLGGLPITAQFGANDPTIPVVQGMVVGLEIPASSTAVHAAAIAGYSRNASTTTNGVAVFGAGLAKAAGVPIWGSNFVISNCQESIGCAGTSGYNGVVAWGNEIDVNFSDVVGTPSFAVRGISIIGASTITQARVGANLFRAIDIDSPGFTQSPKLKWNEALFLEDASAITAISIGTTGVGNNVGSMPLVMRARNSFGVDSSIRIEADPFANAVLTPGSGSSVVLRDGSSGVRVTVNAAGVILNSFASVGVLTVDATGLIINNATLPSAQFPALSGDVATIAGSLATTIGAGRVTNAMLAGSIAASKLVGTDIVTVGTLTAGGTGTGFTIALGTSTVTGIVPLANTAALSGDVSKTAGNNPTVVNKVNGVAYGASPSTNTVPVVTGAGVVTYEAVPNAALATMAALTFKANNTGATAAPSDITVPQLAAMLSSPQVCEIISTSAATCNNGGSAANNATYTTPANAKYLVVEMVGGGGGGGGAGGNGSGTPNGGAGGNGGNTTFGTSFITAGGGVGGNNAGQGAGGTASACDISIAGAPGGPASGTAPSYGGVGGSSVYGGGGGITGPGGGAGTAAGANTGSAGSGAGSSTTPYAGGGGGAGAFCTKLITSPSATYGYAVGAAGSGGTAGSVGGFTGGGGAAGRIKITAYFQ